MKFIVCLLSLLACCGTANATIVFSDPFEDGGRTDGTDANDINWWRANQNLTLGVVADNFAGGGSTNALDIDVGGVDAFKRIVGLYSATTIGSNVGDSLKLSFAFRSVGTPPNNANGFRFGLYNSAGNTNPVDETSTSSNAIEQNDFGYNARVPTGTAAAPDLLDEPAGDNTLGGGTAGSSIRTSFTNVSINDTGLHTFEFTISRASATSLDFVLKVDGNTVANGTDSAGIVTTFDEVYFGTGSTNNFDYRLDNVQLENIAVPEPASLTLLGMAGLGLIALRRTRKLA